MSGRHRDTCSQARKFDGQIGMYNGRSLCFRTSDLDSSKTFPDRVDAERPSCRYTHAEVLTINSSRGLCHSLTDH
jgi:hypothetical protein